MLFKDYHYLYLPRPEKAITYSQIPYFQNTLGFSSAQCKMNGTANVIFVPPDKNVFCMNRHGQKHKAKWSDADLQRFCKKLPGKGWYVMGSELLHSKTPHIKNTVYLFDILVVDGEYLIGSTFPERQAHLYNVILPLIHKSSPDETISHIVMDDHLWLAKNHTGNAQKLFNRLELPEHEGIVLKSATSRLDYCGRKGSNSTGQVKCRRNDLTPNTMF